MQDEILVPYAPVLVESTRSIGYSFESAVADIIDNSIGKKATNIDVIYRSSAEQYLAVIDNGMGMFETDLVKNMRYGSQNISDPRDPDDLGRFGLGMKMASMSQCRKLTVISKRENKLSGVCWDLDYITKKNDWVLQKYDQTELQLLPFVDMLADLESGTIVLWQAFDRIELASNNPQKKFEEKISLARDHIALVFHRFMGKENFGKKVQIFFNNSLVEPMDPFLTNNPATQPLPDQNLWISGKKIVVKPYVLPFISKLKAQDKKDLGDINDLRANQGFYVYRNRRLIIWGTWFRLIKQYELNKLARVRVDIPNTLDSIWDIDIKKSSASLPDMIKKSLVGIVEQTVGRSERVYKYRGRKVSTQNMEHVWETVDTREGFHYKINRSLPLYTAIENCMDESGVRYLDSFVKMIEDAFPYNDAYCRMAKSDEGVIDTTLTFEEVYQVALDMIDQLKKEDKDVCGFIDSMKHIDFFSKHPSVVEKIREEYEVK